MLVYGRDLVIAAFDKRFRRHVARGAVAVGGDHGHLLLHAGQGQNGGFRGAAKTGYARAVQIQLDAGSNPGLDQLVIRIARLDEHAADVRHRARWLEQHQAALRRRAIKTPPFEIVGQSDVIEARVIAAKR